MASILEFRVPPHAKPNGDGGRSCEAANIIIFPGVRYERWSEPPPPQRKKQGKPKRGKAQITD